VVELRRYLRVRERLSDYAAAHIQHMQRALTFMNIQLNLVVFDITGVTGMRIIRPIVGAERALNMLAANRDNRSKSSQKTIEEALKGNYQAKLFLAAVTACKHNPDIRAQKVRLTHAGKTKMQIVGAAMKKLIEIFLV
jgi:hypothetical protein